MVFRPRIYLDSLPEKMRLPIYSTYLYQGVIIPIFGHQRLLGSSGRVEASAPSQEKQAACVYRGTSLIRNTHHPRITIGP